MPVEENVKGGQKGQACLGRERGKRRWQTGVIKGERVSRRAKVAGWKPKRDGHTFRIGGFRVLLTRRFLYRNRSGYNISELEQLN